MFSTLVSQFNVFWLPTFDWLHNISWIEILWSPRTHTHAPEILRRYPSIDHADFPLTNDIAFFCQPEGCIHTCEKRAFYFTGDKFCFHGRSSTLFVFSLTDKDTSKTRYGVCMNFLRPVYKPVRYQPIQKMCQLPRGTFINKIPIVYFLSITAVS